MTSTPEGGPERVYHFDPNGTVTCEECGFRYGAEHMMEDGKSYVCPLCEADALRERVRELGEATRERDRLLHHLEFWANATVYPDDASILPASCSHMRREDFVALVQDVARRALNREDR